MRMQIKKRDGRIEEFNSLKITEPQCSEQEAELRSLTYASNVYINYTYYTIKYK
jgi:DNA-directed RNA polymerase beta subunit